MSNFSIFCPHPMYFMCVMALLQNTQASPVMHHMADRGIYIRLYPLNVTKQYMLYGPFFVFMLTFVSVTKSCLLHQSAKQHYKHTTQILKAHLPNVTLIMFEIHSEPCFKKQNKMSPSTQCTFGSRKASLYF